MSTRTKEAQQALEQFGLGFFRYSMSYLIHICMYTCIHTSLFYCDGVVPVCGFLCCRTSGYLWVIAPFGKRPAKDGEV